MFDIYLQLGFEHILDIHAYDHILFVFVLCAVYALDEWKKILILVTAFTLGHSLTLALSAFHLIEIPAAVIEKLIPLTIIATAAYNLQRTEGDKKIHVLYFMSAFFGTIHGLGFSNYLKALLGNEENIVTPLLAFNMGVEGGQLIIVFSALILRTFIVNILHLPDRIWNKVISLLTIAVASYLLLIQL